MRDPGWFVPELPAQGLGLGDEEGAGEAELLKPSDERVVEGDHGEPGPVGADVGEREPARAGILESFDVILDVGVGAHVHVESDRVAGGVGVVTPVAEHDSGNCECWAPG